MPDPSPSTLTAINSNFLQLGRRSGGRPQPTVYPSRLPVNCDFCETHCVSGDWIHNLPIVSPTRYQLYTETTKELVQSLLIRHSARKPGGNTDSPGWSQGWSTIRGEAWEVMIMVTGRKVNRSKSLKCLREFHPYRLISSSPSVTVYTTPEVTQRRSINPEVQDKIFLFRKSYQSLEPLTWDIESSTLNSFKNCL